MGKKNKTRRGKNGGRQQKNAMKELPVNITTYRGPVVIPASMRADRVTTLNMTLLTGMSSSSSGLMVYAFTNNPSNYTDWASISAQYAEYRVLAMKIQYIPFYEHWGSTTAQGQNQTPIVWYPIRNTGNAAPTSRLLAFDYEGARPKSVQDRMTMTIKMDGPAEGEFDNVSSVNATFGIGATATGLSNSIQYGECYQTILIQFRQRI